MEYTIHHKDGTSFAVAKSITYSAKRMGEKYVTATINSATPIKFEIGDYIDYRNERFTINVVPTVKKTSSSGSIGNAFTYDSIKFSSCITELTDCSFRDIVPSDNNIHTAMPVFDFYASSVSALTERIEANLKKINSYWEIDVTATSGQKDKVIKISKPMNCWEALALVNSEFKLNFYIEGRHIYVGDYGTSINSTDLQYGLNNGLLSIERKTDESQQIITRLRAYGNSTNIPSRFYANLGVTCWLSLNTSSAVAYKASWKNGGVTTDEKKTLEAAGWKLDELMPVIQRGFVDSDGVLVKAIADQQKVLTPSCFTMYDEVLKYAPFSADGFASIKMANYGASGDISFFIEDTTVDKIKSASKIEMSGTRTISIDTWPESYKRRSEDALPNNMHIDRLMLPDFPTSTIRSSYRKNTFSYSESKTDPYIEHKAAMAAYGTREASVYFDGSDDREDIYPTLDGFGVSIVSTSGYSDNGVFGTDNTSEVVPPFEIVIDFSSNPFNVWQYRVPGEKPRISMKSGPCEGREFEITKVRKDTAGSNRYILTCNRAEDSGLRLYFPYNSYPINSKSSGGAGDKFVFLGIEMPPQYVDAAAKRLLDAAEQYLLNNCEIKYNYTLNFSSIYIAKHSSFASSLAVGKLLKFSDPNIISNSLSIPIETLEIREGSELLPRYTITLSEDTTVSTITRVQNNITAVGNAAITSVYPLSFRAGGKLVGVYNPTEKGLIVDLGVKSDEEGDCNASMCKITESIKAGKDVGYIKNGETIAQGTSIQDIFKKLLIGTVEPTINRPTISVSTTSELEYNSKANAMNIVVTMKQNDGGAFAGKGKVRIKMPDGTYYKFGTNDYIEFDSKADGSATITIADSYLLSSIGSWTIEASLDYAAGTEASKVTAGTATASANTSVYVLVYYGVIGGNADGKLNKTFSNSEISTISTTIKLSSSDNYSVNTPAGKGTNVVIAYPKKFVESIEYTSVVSLATNTPALASWTDEDDIHNRSMDVNGQIKGLDYHLIGRWADSNFGAMSITVNIKTE